MGIISSGLLVMCVQVTWQVLRITCYADHDSRYCVTHSEITYMSTWHTMTQSLIYYLLLHRQLSLTLLLSNQLNVFWYVLSRGLMKCRDKLTDGPVSMRVSCSQPGNQTRASPGPRVTCRGWRACRVEEGGKERGKVIEDLLSDAFAKCL